MPKWEGAYKDYLGRNHHREISLNNRTWRIKDTISGQFDEAILRWRLKPIKWLINGNFNSQE